MKFIFGTLIALAAAVVSGAPAPEADALQLLERADRVCWIVDGKSQECVKSPTDFTKVGTLAAGSSSGPTFGVSCWKFGNLWSDNGEYSKLFFKVPAYKCYVNSLHVDSSCYYSGKSFQPERIRQTLLRFVIGDIHLAGCLLNFMRSCAKAYARYAGMLIPRNLAVLAMVEIISKPFMNKCVGGVGFVSMFDRIGTVTWYILMTLNFDNTDARCSHGWCRLRCSQCGPKS
jgi:hypothetical protein